MTLPATGSISLSQVNVELGRAAATRISLGEAAVRNLAGVSSGTIRMSNLRGKSNVTFTKSGTGRGMSYAEVTFSCNVPATWYVDGSLYASNRTSITLSLSAPMQGSYYRPASRSYTVYGVANGVTSQTWTGTLEVYGNL